jgi:uncharacterized protein YlxW (UPF0749 family)
MIFVKTAVLALASGLFLSTMAAAVPQSSGAGQSVLKLNETELLSPVRSLRRELASTEDSIRELNKQIREAHARSAAYAANRNQNLANSYQSLIVAYEMQRTTLVAQRKQLIAELKQKN